MLNFFFPKQTSSLSHGQFIFKKKNVLFFAREVFLLLIHM